MDQTKDQGAAGIAAHGREELYPLLLAAASTALRDHVLGQVAEPDALEYASVVQLMLDRMAMEHRREAQLAETTLPALIALIDRARTVQGIAGDDVARPADIRAARAMLSQLLLALTENAAQPESEHAEVVQQIGRVEIDRRLKLSRPPAPIQTPPGGEHEAPLSIDRMSAYIQASPDLSDLRISHITKVGGGRSKDTHIVTLERSLRHPDKVVMRQDIASAYIDTSVVDEHKSLLALASLNLSVIAEPLFIDDGPNDLGGPFYWMTRLHGRPAGSYFAFEAGPEVCLQLAAALAAIHNADVALFPHLIPPDSPLASARQKIRDYAQQWQRDAVEPSPLIDYAFHWLLQNGTDQPHNLSLVHGDVRPHNLLADDDRLTGVLDWEFVHLGDPAEDLAYCRSAVSEVVPWASFMQAYHDAGGASISDDRLRFFEIWGFARNAAFGASATRQFLDGVTDDIRQGGQGYHSIHWHEEHIARLLN